MARCSRPLRGRPQRNTPPPLRLPMPLPAPAMSLPSLPQSLRREAPALTAAAAATEALTAGDAPTPPAGLLLRGGNDAPTAAATRS